MMLHRAITALAVVASCLVIAVAAEEGVEPAIIPPKIKAPESIYSNCYPDSARYEQREGRLTVNFTVEPDGSVSNVIFPSGIEPWLRKAALCMLRKVQFTPGTLDGKPVAASAKLPINFNLTDLSGESVELDWPQLLSTAQDLERAYRACYPEDALGMQTARYKLTVGTDGRARKVQVVESGGDPTLDEVGICIIGLLQFTPTQRGGQSVVSTLSLPLRVRPAR